ncbi:MAG: alkaline phosphatase family protein [Ferrovibrio sp.]|uniref:alkaline phosphatase family protein n=1 Tax=Ferrovibrio sp. TaxID=1917215 RepID=UPI00260C519B|nr:alkaline phosphatase family protein [Ferrovibrio sp.]MCW0232121.1 alkaline phosphatase family protein [Ferrovibrio sp.]
MAAVRNILFIMADQLRADYLSCTGHPTLQTPHMDALAKRGVLFDRAYCQAPVCGPSRMSFYTGRYMTSHGATYNNVPLRATELTLGDYLRPLGYRVALVGKTHMKSDDEGMKRLGVDPKSSLGVLISECGFEPVERDDGLHPNQLLDPDLAYNTWLRNKGYVSDNPWHDFANAAEGPDGEILSGWYMRNANLPARIREEDSETPYMTDRAIDFIRESGDRPWCLHLSYIKPHWPYIAPAPYHNMYGIDQILPAHRREAERQNPHPVVEAFMQHEESVNFCRDEVRETVIPAYMGLVKQLDDHLGRLFAFLEASGRMQDTLIVLTSDHGDYLGDHWLGEKELFHEESVRIPMIVCHPDAAADATRGRVDHAFVEAIDLIPTFLEAAGGAPQPHRLEGRSLLPRLFGQGAAHWRDAAFSECDYAFRPARQTLNLPPDRARAYMVRTDRWKYIAYDGFRPQLFDLRDDPGEYTDLGESPDHAAIRADLAARLFDWLRQRRIRTTLSDAEVEKRTGTAKARGMLFGVW